MESLIQSLTEISIAIEAEILEKYRQFTNIDEMQRGVYKELRHLMEIDLEANPPAYREAWLRRVYMNLRMLRVNGEREITVSAMSSNLFSVSQAAEVDVLDILAESTPWKRLVAIGNVTYEQAIHSLRAMAVMDMTLASSTEDYVPRFCTEYGRFRPATATALLEQSWLPLLLSVRKALKVSLVDDLTITEIPQKRIEERVTSAPAAVSPWTALRQRQNRASLDQVLGQAVRWMAALWKRGQAYGHWRRRLPLLSRIALPPASSVPTVMESVTVTAQE